MFALNWQIFGISLLFWALAILIRYYLHRLIVYKFGGGFLQSLKNFAAENYKPLSHWIIMGCIVAPFCEEVVFRLPLAIFFKSEPIVMIFAVLVSSILFGICHIFECPSFGIGRDYGLYLFVWTFLHSIVLGASFLAAQSLLAPILIHSTVNAFVLWEIYRYSKTQQG